MSEQNKKTLRVYDRLAQKYMDNTTIHDSMNPAKAKKKQAKLESFLLDSFGKIPRNGKILEIGSGDGANASFLKKAGFDIVASDIAEAFLGSCRQCGLTTIKLDAIEDELPDGLSGVLAWRTFVHFTKADLEKTLQKIHSALVPSGVFVFNVFNQEDSGINEQWKDFPDEYEMGEERYFAYYTEEYINDLLERIGFKIDRFFKQGGKTEEKWLCYAVKK